MVGGKIGRRGQIALIICLRVLIFGFKCIPAISNVCLLIGLNQNPKESCLSSFIKQRILFRVFPRRRTMISFLEKRENVACLSKSIDCARGTTSFALVKHRGGGRAQDVAWRMLPSLHKFPIRHRSSRFSSFPEEDALEAVYFIYIINSHNDLHRAYFCKFPSNRDPIALNAMDSVIQFQRLKITQQLFPSMGRNASCCTQIDSRDCNRSQF